jgi:uncharacterized membrane protein YjjB (DUF3815 family)
MSSEKRSGAAVREGLGGTLELQQTHKSNEVLDSDEKHDATNEALCKKARRGFLQQAVGYFLTECVAGAVPFILIDFVAGFAARACDETKMKFTCPGDVCLWRWEPSESIIAIFPDSRIGLAKLVRMHEVLMDAVRAHMKAKKTGVDHDDSNFAKARAELDEIVKEKDLYPRWVQPYAMGLIGFGYCPLFGGGISECLVAFLIATLIGYSHYFKRLADNYDSIKCMLIGGYSIFGSLFIYKFIAPELDAPTAGLSALMWWLPGLSIEMAMQNITTGYARVGISQLTNALTYCFLLAIGMGFGYAMCFELGIEFDHENVEVQFPLAEWSYPFFVLIATIGAMMMKQCTMKHWHWIWIGSLAGLYATIYAPAAFGSFTPLFGGLALEFTSEMITAYCGLFHVEVFVIGLLPIVPGSTALNSAFADFDSGNDNSNANSSVDFLAAMFQIAFSINLGITMSRFLFGWINVKSWSKDRPHKKRAVQH